MGIFKDLTQKHKHLEWEDIQVETVLFDPLIVFDDIEIEASIGEQASEEHHCKVIANFQWGVSTAVHICAYCIMKQAQFSVDGIWSVTRICDCAVYYTSIYS